MGFEREGEGEGEEKGVLGCFGFWGCVVLFIGDEKAKKQRSARESSSIGPIVAIEVRGN